MTVSKCINIFCWHKIPFYQIIFWMMNTANDKQLLEAPLQLGILFLMLY